MACQPWRTGRGDEGPIPTARGARQRAMKAAMLDNVKSDAVTGWWTRSRTFLVEVRNELKRVTWPSRKEVYATTFVVIVTAVLFGVYLWLLDQVFDTVVFWIIGRFGA